MKWCWEWYPCVLILLKDLYEKITIKVQFIAKHWHLQPHEVTYSDLQTVKRKICQLFSISDSLSKVCLDWNFDDDENYRYKFDIERRKHSLEKGMWILLSVWGSPCREQTGIITEVLPDGIIIQADGYVDTSEEYSIMKIEKPVVYQENGLLWLCKRHRVVSCAGESYV